MDCDDYSGKRFRVAADVLRIANCSGFYGDRMSAAREMVEGGPIDVLTGDYLAELTLLILWKDQQRDPSLGYARTFLRQMESVLGTCLAKGIRIVANAGGLNPGGLARELGKLAERLGLHPKIAYIEGDDLLPRIGELQSGGEEFRHLDSKLVLADSRIVPVAANAYLGGWGIAKALELGADVVICPRVTDASVTVGPAAWHFGWKRDDWDRLAGAVVAGHLIECGAQVTGGNFAFFKEVPGLRRPGFPIAEMHADGSCVITKHAGTGGLVSTETVTAQLLYEIGGPQYLNPDVVARLDTVRLATDGTDRVRVFGVRGEPAPSTTKVCINYIGGYRNSATFQLTGLDIEAKAELATETLFEIAGGRERFDQVEVNLVRSDVANPPSNERATATLRITVKDPVAEKVGRAFSNAAVEMALASYPGMYGFDRPSAAEEYSVYWPALVSSTAIHEVVVAPDGMRVAIEAIPGSESTPTVAVENDVRGRSVTFSGGSRQSPLGAVIGARSGDKGGNANIGLWARGDLGYAWLREFLTVEAFRALVPDSDGLEIRRYELPNIRSINFVVAGLLGEGVSSTARMDAQAKSLGEYVRAKVVDIPVELLENSRA